MDNNASYISSDELNNLQKNKYISNQEGDSFQNNIDNRIKNIIDNTYIPLLVDENNKKIKELAENVTNLEKEISLKKDEIEKLRNRIFEALGVFVALITFISANVTALANIKSISIAVIFMFSFLICIFLFLYILHIVINNKSKDEIIRTCLWILLICFAASFLTFTVEKEIKKNDYLNKIREEIKNQICTLECPPKQPILTNIQR